MATALYVRANETGAKAQNVEFLASDFATGNIAGHGMDLIVEISISAGTTPDVEISFDSGNTWAILFSSLALNTITRARAMGIDVDAINFRSPSVGGLTLARFLVIGDVDA